MNIEFVNHASYIVRHDGISMICDPWIEGTAFDNGWALLTDTKFTYPDYKDITHIWFSHEHPDHFSPPNISKIPEELRKNIVVLYHETLDKKVVNWCRQRNFKEVIELTKDTWYQLSADFHIMCSPYGDDSWLCVKTSEKNILNLNDCVIDTEAEAIKVRDIIQAPVDILLTQFSYAQYEGNRDRPDEREKAAVKKFEQMKIQVDVFGPGYVIPFASYVWFCHEENYYMNDKINKPDKVDAFLRSCGVKPVILYPGDVWHTNDTTYNSSAAITKWLAAYDRVQQSPKLVQPKYVTFEDLKKSEHALQEKLYKKYGKLNFKITYRKLPSLRIYVADHNKTVVLSHLHGISADNDVKNYDVSMSSDALNYCLKMAWGFNTTHVNGRMEFNENGMERFGTYEGISNSLNHDHKVDGLFQKIMNRLMPK